MILKVIRMQLLNVYPPWLFCIIVINQVIREKLERFWGTNIKKQEIKEVDFRIESITKLVPEFQVDQYFGEPVKIEITGSLDDPTLVNVKTSQKISEIVREEFRDNSVSDEGLENIIFKD